MIVLFNFYMLIIYYKTILCST